MVVIRHSFSSVLKIYLNNSCKQLEQPNLIITFLRLLRLISACSINIRSSNGRQTLITGKPKFLILLRRLDWLLPADRWYCSCFLWWPIQSVPPYSCQPIPLIRSKTKLLPSSLIWMLSPSSEAQGIANSQIFEPTSNPNFIDYRSTPCPCCSSTNSSPLLPRSYLRIWLRIVITRT